MILTVRFRLLGKFKLKNQLAVCVQNSVKSDYSNIQNRANNRAEFIRKRSYHLKLIIMHLIFPKKVQKNKILKKQTEKFYFFVTQNPVIHLCTFIYVSRSWIWIEFRPRMCFCRPFLPKKYNFFYEILKTKYLIINFGCAGFSHNRTECLSSVFCMNLHFLIALETYNEVLE